MLTVVFVTSLLLLLPLPLLVPPPLGRRRGNVLGGGGLQRRRGGRDLFWKDITHARHQTYQPPHIAVIVHCVAGGC